MLFCKEMLLKSICIMRILLNQIILFYTVFRLVALAKPQIEINKGYSSSWQSA